MYVYWTMYALPALFTLAGGRRREQLDALNKLGILFLFVLYTVLIGLRFEVGADWFAYEEIVAATAYEDLATAMSYGDPGFALVAWVSTHSGAHLYGANLFCGAALLAGLVAFCRRQDHVWLALAASVPYLLIVVGMGYVRQGAAIGFLLFAILRFEDRRFVRSFVWVGVAGLFHASAIVLAPLLGLAIVRKRPIFLVPVVLVSAGLFVVLLQERVDAFYTNYVEAEYDSSGALVRLLMNAVPALLFFAYRRRFPANDWSRFLWLELAGAALLLVAFVAISPSTTLIDRIGLYLIPIQVYVFGNLSYAMGASGRGRFAVSVLTLGYYAAIQFVWLNFATHAEYWLPYRFAPLEG